MDVLPNRFSTSMFGGEAEITTYIIQNISTMSDDKLRTDSN